MRHLPFFSFGFGKKMTVLCGPPTGPASTRTYFSESMKSRSRGMGL